MARSPIRCSMCHLLVLLLTLRAEIPCHHPNLYFLKDPKGCALVQGPFLGIGRVLDHHIPGQDQGPQAVDLPQGKLFVKTHPKPKVSPAIEKKKNTSIQNPQAAQPLSNTFLVLPELRRLFLLTHSFPSSLKSVLIEHST